MEEFVNVVTGGAIWGVGFAVASGLVQTAGRGLRPIAMEAMKTVVAAGDWARTTAEQGRESLEDMYHEAVANRSAETPSTRSKRSE